MTTKIYGTSDDLIEFEGDIYDEIGAYKAQDKGILLSDGTVLAASLIELKNVMMKMQRFTLTLCSSKMA